MTVFTPTEANQIAEHYFGIKGTAMRLPGEYDCNFHLKAHAGKEYLLKISHPQETREYLELQQAILQHLNQSSLPFKTPMPRPALSGEWITTLTEHHHFVRLFTFTPGKLLGDVRYHTPELLESLGTQLGHLSLALQHFQHPAAQRVLKWDLQQADWISEHLYVISDSEERHCVTYFWEKFRADALPKLNRLRHSVIHGDMNDYNILVSHSILGQERVIGFVDFGDVVATATICELAIALAYIMLMKPDPLAAAAQVVKAYHTIFPLQENEIDILFDLICMRLCISVVNSALRKQENPHDAYLTISEQPAWALLKTLRTIHPRLALYTFRDACQWEPCPHTSAVIAWLKAAEENIAPLLDVNLRTAKIGVLDLSPSGTGTADTNNTEIELWLGQYNEARLIYSAPQYHIKGNEGNEARTVHIGLDLSAAPGTPVYAPLNGIVHSVADNDLPKDYGPTIILEHHVPEQNLTFYTLYGHLNRASLTQVTVGNTIAKGALLGWIGDKQENGGWAPHLHLQIITDMLDYTGNYPGVCRASNKSIWLSLCPDPNLLTRIPAHVFPQTTREKSHLLTARKKLIADNIGLSYQQPLQIVRGKGQYLFDENGRRYLDCVNNVCHVGHCHPKVVSAGQKQMALLNTNTRYLHASLSLYAEKLIATLPAPLEVCFFVCSGSEANELALRLARTHTRRHDILVMDHGYYGNTSTLINISPYKFNGKGGYDKPDFVHVLPLFAKGPIPEQIAAFICESLPSCGGQIVFPENYLTQLYAAVRKAGGVCVADEVQVGLGRVGTHYWGFETQGVVPDIVSMGKPLGNGHPISAVVTTREIADSFNNGMEYFNTFGGNTVSCAIGHAVLAVLAEENLQEHALHTGTYLKQHLAALKKNCADDIIDVRGLGLFLGVELSTKELAAFVVNRMKERGILLSADGPKQNVLKIKPPLVINRDDCDEIIENLASVLSFCRH